jgi:hypothetical protein
VLKTTSPSLEVPNGDSDSKSLRFIVFGLGKTRLWALERHWRLRRALREAGAIQLITLVGKRHEAADEREWSRLKSKIGGTVHWKTRFDLSTDEISRELASHDFGLLANEPDILTKSGVFAALASHGTIPIVAAPSQADLPEPWCEAAIANDDGEAIPQVRSMLSDKARLRQMHESLLEFSAHELAWNRITEKWNEMLFPSSAPDESRLLAVQHAGNSATSLRETRRTVIAPV